MKAIIICHPEDTARFFEALSQRMEVDPVIQLIKGDIGTVCGGVNIRKLVIGDVADLAAVREGKFRMEPESKTAQWKRELRGHRS